MISANWMTLGFANAKRNVQAPARDPSENSARAARNFAEPFSCDAPSGTGPGEGLGAPCAAAGPGSKGVVAWPPPPCPGALSGGQLRPRGRRLLPHPILSAPGRHAGGAQPALPRPSAPASTHRAPPPGEHPSELAGLPLLPSAPWSPPASSPSLWSSRPSPDSPKGSAPSSTPKPFGPGGCPEPCANQSSRTFECAGEKRTTAYKWPEFSLLRSFITL